MNQTSGVTPTTQRADLVSRLRSEAEFYNSAFNESQRRKDLLPIHADVGWRSTAALLDEAATALCTEQPVPIHGLRELVKQWRQQSETLRREMSTVWGDTPAAQVQNEFGAKLLELCTKQLERVLNSGEHSVQGSSDTPSAEKLAQTFHEVYERLAPEFGYETRKDSAVQWEDVPEKNRRLMTATCGVILSYLFPLAAMTSHSSEGQQP